MRISSLLIVLSLVVFLVAFWNRNDIPGSVAPLPQVLQAPEQVAEDLPPFLARFNGIDYTVDPQFRYVLHGLVVSYRHHDGNSFMHRFSRDHLNMMDMCVVWGGNVDPGLLHEFTFWNGIFTCEFRTKSSEAWARFDPVAASNNHLLSDDPMIRGRIGDLRIGDQVRVEGWLASYGADPERQRGTSTTRTDTGDGACETLYVERFDILERPFNPWRTVMWSALGVLGLAGFTWLAAPHRPY